MADLTPKQATFVREYLIDLNVLAAAERAEIELAAWSPQSGYYVYLLTDPRTASIIYVGKGKGRRIFAHEAEERGGRATNGAKALALGDLRRAGVKPGRYLFATGLNEGAAFTIERLLIAELKDGLTNALPGVKAAAEREREMAASRLADIIPFDRWVARKDRTPFEIKLYHTVVSGLRCVAEHGAVTTITVPSRGHIRAAG